MADQNRNVGRNNQLHQSAQTDTTTHKNVPVSNPLPIWKVLLHDDDDNVIADVVTTILMLTFLNERDAIDKTLEAHKKGVSLLLTTHQERAELYACQFASCNLSVTIEKA